MNKGELIEKVAKECALGKSAAEQVLASVFGAITDAMAAGEKGCLARLWNLFGIRAGSA